MAELLDGAPHADQLRRRIIDDQYPRHVHASPRTTSNVILNMAHGGGLGPAGMLVPAQATRTTVRPCEPPASIVSNTPGRSSSATSLRAIASRCIGFQSLERCVQISSRIARAVPAEATPSRLTPRMMKGITVVASSMPPALPLIAMLPYGLMTRERPASMSP